MSDSFEDPVADVGGAADINIDNAQGLLIGNDNEQNNTFIYEQHIHQHQQPIVWPIRVGRMPPRPQHMQPRTVLQPVSEPGRSRVIYGLGGIGKSQLAAEVVRGLEQEQRLDLSVWVP